MWTSKSINLHCVLLLRVYIIKVKLGIFQSRFNLLRELVEVLYVNNIDSFCFEFVCVRNLL